MTDLDTGYTHDYRSDNQTDALDYSLEQAIDIAADCLTSRDEIVLILSVVFAHNYIDLEISYDLVDNSDCSYFDNPDLFGN